MQHPRQFCSIFVFFSLIIGMHLGYSQPSIQWQKSYGTKQMDAAGEVLPTADGGFLITSKASSSASGDKTHEGYGSYDAWVLKLSATGAIEWQKIFGGSQSDELLSGCVLPDGGYLLAGTSYSDVSGNKTEKSRGKSDIWLVKLDTKGNIVSQKVYGGKKYEGWITENIGKAILVTAQDGGYVLGCTSNSEPSGDKTTPEIGSNDFWVLKFNPSLEIEWQKSYGSKSIEILFALQPAKDGFLLVGSTNGGGSGNIAEKSKGFVDGWVIKIDLKGNLLWEKGLGGNLDDLAYAVLPTEDGGALVALSSMSTATGDKTEKRIGYVDLWMVKMSSAGKIEWQKLLGGNNIDDPEVMIKTSDGQFVIGCISNSGDGMDKKEKGRGDFDIWLLKVDKNAKIQWEKTLGGKHEDKIRGLAQTKDGGLILAVSSFSDISGDKTEAGKGMSDVWIVKLK